MKISMDMSKGAYQIAKRVYLGHKSQEVKGKLKLTELQV